MQKTFLKFLLFELVERLVRFESLLDELAGTPDGLPNKTAPGLTRALQSQVDTLKEKTLADKAFLNKLFSEGELPAGAKLKEALAHTVFESYTKLQELSRLLGQLYSRGPLPEISLFLADALPMELTQAAGEQALILEAEWPEPAELALNGVLLERLSVLQRNNPLAWVTLGNAFARHHAQTHFAKADAETQALARHAVNLRLMGPAYYLQQVTDAFLKQDTAFLCHVEPALFYGLNHLNFVNKSLVILHESVEPALELLGGKPVKQKESALADLFRTAEKTLPEKYAFEARLFERILPLQQRLAQGVLLSGTAHFPVDEVEATLEHQRESDSLAIYDLLGMLTEYPHSPREIVNAGWLHKMERSPVWLYSVTQDGFDTLKTLLDYQDHLLAKSIETSEVHRMLLA